MVLGGMNYWAKQLAVLKCRVLTVWSLCKQNKINQMKQNKQTNKQAKILVLA